MSVRGMAEDAPQNVIYRCGVIYNSDILTDSTLGGCFMAWHFEVVVVDRIKIKIDVLDG